MTIPRLGIGLICWFPAVAAILAASYVLLGSPEGTSLGWAISSLFLVGLLGLAGVSPSGRLAFGRCLKAIGICYAIATAIGILGHYPEPLALMDPTQMHDAPILALVIGGIATMVLFPLGFLITYEHEPGRPSLLVRSVVPTLARATAGIISDRRLRAHRRLDDGVFDGTAGFDESSPHLKGFNHYYRQNIRRQLDGLEQERRTAIKRRNIRLLIGVPIMSVLSVMAVENIEEESFWLEFAGFALLVGWLALFGYAAGPRRKIRVKAKSIMIACLSEFFQLDYRAHTNSVDLSLYQTLNLIPEHGRAAARESFSGKRGEVEMFMAEAKAYAPRRKGGRGQRGTVFNGAVLRFTYRKPIRSQTVALSDRGMIANLVGQALGEKKRLRLENKEFEDIFDVFSEDEVEARYLLTPLFMERMVHLANLVGKQSNIRFGFGENSLLVAMNGWDLFEASALSHAVNDPLQVQTFINEIGLVLDIVDTLKLTLETRI